MTAKKRIYLFCVLLAPSTCFSSNSEKIQVDDIVNGYAYSSGLFKNLCSPVPETHAIQGKDSAAFLSLLLLGLDIYINYSGGYDFPREGSDGCHEVATWDIINTNYDITSAILERYSKLIKPKTNKTKNIEKFTPNCNSTLIKEVSSISAEFIAGIFKVSCQEIDEIGFRVVVRKSNEKFIFYYGVVASSVVYSQLGSYPIHIEWKPEEKLYISLSSDIELKLPATCKSVYDIKAVTVCIKKE